MMRHFAIGAEGWSLDMFRRRARRLLRFSSLATLLLPALAAALYAWALATPQYVADAAFVIRGREAPQASGGGLFGLGGGGSALQSLDAVVVAEFATSHDALSQLRARADYDGMMKKAENDPLMRFSVRPGTAADLSYFNDMVRVDFSLTTQIVTLRAFAFAPGDAAEIAATMLGIAEDFANLMNERARDDLLRATEREVLDAAEDLRQRQSAVQLWRLENGNIDPALETEIVMQSINRIEEALTESRIDLARLNSLADPGARARDLRTRIEVLTRELMDQKGRLTGARDDSLARQTMNYERLLLAQTISQELYSAAVEALAEARTEANRQQKFLTVVKSPVADVSPAWPNGIPLISLTFAASVFVWLIARFFYDAATEGLRR